MGMPLHLNVGQNISKWVKLPTHTLMSQNVHLLKEKVHLLKTVTAVTVPVTISVDFILGGLLVVLITKS